MRPYGQRLDSHRYALNDNNKRVAVATRVARKRARRDAANDVRPWVDEMGCADCGEIDSMCDCLDRLMVAEMEPSCDFDCLECWWWKPLLRRSECLTAPMLSFATSV